MKNPNASNNTKEFSGENGWKKYVDIVNTSTKFYVRIDIMPSEYLKKFMKDNNLANDLLTLANCTKHHEAIDLLNKTLN